MKFQDDQAYGASLNYDIKERFFDYLKDGVQAPHAVIVPLRSALIPANPDTDLIPVSECAPRKAWITKEDLLKHGYTPGCPGCIAAQGEGSRHFRRHTDQCRRRMIELLPEARQKSATDRLDRWTAEQVGKGDVHDTNSDDAMGDSTKASGSGSTEAERAIGRAEADTNVAPEPERFDISSPARGEGLNIELHEAPSTNPGLRNRAMTPERPAAEKRPID